MSPKPPPLIMMSVALSALSGALNLPCRWAHFAQRRRLRNTPLAAADSGSNALLVSIRAQHSPFCVTCLINESNKVVRPDDGGPQISVSEPRGMPMDFALSSAIPVEIVSGTILGLGVRAPGIRFARVASICVRRMEAADVIRDLAFRRIRLSFA